MNGDDNEIEVRLGRIDDRGRSKSFLNEVLRALKGGRVSKVRRPEGIAIQHSGAAVCSAPIATSS
jgi:hypothetical protein